MTMAKKSAASQVDDEREPADADGFWTQWGTTSIADVSRDTYGADKRSTLEREYRSDAE